MSDKIINTTQSPFLPTWFNVSVYLSLIFLAFGVFTSISLPSLFHILMIAPIIFSLIIKKQKIQWKLSSYFLVGFVIWHLVSFAYNFPQNNTSFESYHLGKIKYWLFAILAIVPLNLYFHQKNLWPLKRHQHILIFFGLGIILSASYGLIGQVFDFDLLTFSRRVFEHREAGLIEEMRYGYASSLIIIAIASFLLHKYKTLKKSHLIFSTLVLLMAMIGLLGTQTRGAIVSFLCSLVFVFYFYKKKWGLIYLVTFVIATASFFAIRPHLQQITKHRFINTHDVRVSNGKRLGQYQAALYAFKDNKMFGLGPNQFQNFCSWIKMNYQIPFPNYQSHSHNIFLEQMANLGLLGFVFFLGWLLAWIWELYALSKTANPLPAFIIIPAIFNFMIGGQFELNLDSVNSFIICALYTLSGIQWNNPQTLKHS